MAVRPRRDAPPADAAPGANIVDLGAVAVTLERQAGHSSGDRTARSIFQTDTLGAVVTALRAGASASNPTPDEATIIQGIRGECLISLDGEGAVIGPGTLVGIAPGVAWRLLARTDAVVLLTVAPAPTAG